jgi:quercetin dioxygenase-like cupin family protein
VLNAAVASARLEPNPWIADLPLDELVGAPDVVPLTRQPRGLHVWKVVLPPGRKEPELRTHEAYEWLYVLAGQMRLILAEHDITMGPGEVAEFDTQLPHWFGAAGDEPVEILSLLGRQGERIHVRAAPRRKAESS